MGDREQILYLLKEANRRTRVNSRLEGLSKALMAAVPIPTAVVLCSWFLSVSEAVVWASVAVGVVVSVLVFFASQFRRNSQLSEVAWEIDRKRKLQDELRTSYWFLSHDYSSPWIDLQISRAAKKIPHLDLEQLYARVFPKSIYLALSLAALLPFFYQTQQFFHNPPTGTPLTLVGEQQALLKSAGDHLKQSRSKEALEAIKLLQDVQEDLLNGTLSAEAVKQLLSEIEDVLLHPNNLEDLKAGLEQIAGNLELIPKIEGLLDELENRDLKEAASKLETPSQGLGKVPANRNQAVAQLSNESISRTANFEMESLSQALSDFDKKNQAGDARGVEEALEKARTALDNLSQKLHNQQAQDMAALQISKLKESLETPNENTARMQASQSSQASSDAGEEVTSTKLGNQTRGEPRLGSSQQAQKTSNPGQGQMTSGTGTGSHLERKEQPTQLEVQLEKEYVAGTPDGSRAGRVKTEQIRSRFEESMVPYSDASVRLTPAQADRLTSDSIPWDYRDLIKDYFKKIRSSGKNTP